MRTTINLPDDVLARIKRHAADSQTTITAFIEDAVREALARRAKKARINRPALTTYGEKGLQPGVDLDDSAALLNLMDQPDDTGRR
ncbi:MAG: CopG family transcriptional regulator [Burkholderiales bacterium]